MPLKQFKVAYVVNENVYYIKPDWVIKFYKALKYLLFKHYTKNHPKIHFEI